MIRSFIFNILIHNYSEEPKSRIWVIILLGVAYMLLFTASETCRNIKVIWGWQLLWEYFRFALQIIIVKSIRKDYINFRADAYLAHAVVHGAWALSMLAIPLLIRAIHAKYSMVIGAILITLYIANFLKPCTWLLYLASVLKGFGTAILWTAHGHYIVLNSLQSTLARNVGIFWAMLQLR